MAGYCTACGGSGYRRPAAEKRATDLVAQIARMTPYEEFDSEDGRDAVNGLIREAKKIAPKNRRPI